MDEEGGNSILVRWLSFSSRDCDEGGPTYYRHLFEARSLGTSRWSAQDPSRFVVDRGIPGVVSRESRRFGLRSHSSYDVPEPVESLLGHGCH